MAEQLKIRNFVTRRVINLRIVEKVEGRGGATRTLTYTNTRASIQFLNRFEMLQRLVGSRRWQDKNVSEEDRAEEVIAVRGEDQIR